MEEGSRGGRGDKGEDGLGNDGWVEYGGWMRVGGDGGWDEGGLGGMKRGDRGGGLGNGVGG